MRKIASLLSVLLLFCAFVMGQTTRTISGQVTNDKGQPVSFATVTETGTQNAAVADVNGNFRITIKDGSTLTISGAGHDAKTVTPTGTTVNVTLASIPGEMAEVVVTTAFGIKKAQRTTPYSAQVLNNEQLQMIPHKDINSALAGKVVGAQFRGQSPMKLNDNGYFRIRGGLSIGDVAPLYIVDGTPVNSFDLSPEDIEDVTILKGANATALFGTDARGGAVVITTRKKGLAGGSGIEVSQGVTFDRVYILPDYQNLYAGGSFPDLAQFSWQPGMPDEWQALDGKFFHDYTDDASWGPRMVGQEYIPWYAWTPGHQYSGMTARLTPQPDNAQDFYNTGISNVTNVSFSKAGQGFNSRISYTFNKVRGMLPSTSQEKHTIFATAQLKLNDHFDAGANINFVNNKIHGEFVDGYANQSSGSFNQWFHRDLNMDIMKELRSVRTPIGTFPSWNLSANPDAGVVDRVWKGNYWYNFFTYFDQVDFNTTRDRLFGDIFLSYSPIQDLRFRAVVRKNQLNTASENITPTALESSATQTGILDAYSTAVTRSDIMTYELHGNYTRRIVDRLEMSTNLGASWMRSRLTSTSAASVNGLNVPDFYSISNSVAQPTIGNTRDRQETRSAFGHVDFEWDRMISAQLDVRNDYYSTNLMGDNLVSYAVGGTFVFSELTKSALPWLSFGKLKGSYGKKPNPLGLYQNNFLYGVNQNQWNGNILMGTPNTFINPGVTGNLIGTLEFGIELRALKNRIGLDVVYFHETNEDEPLTVVSPPTTGFTSELINALTVERDGLEVQLTGRPIVRQNFNWEVIVNFAQLLNNPVSNLPEGVPQIALAAGAFGTRFARVFHEEDQDWGQLIGGGIRRTADGLPLIDANGLFVRDATMHWGSIVPKTTGGLINTLTYKNFLLNFNIDYQVGGKFFSLSEQWGHYSGLLAATAATNDRGWNVRDAVADGGGVHVVGISAADERTPVDMYVDAQTYFHQFYGSQIAEPFIHSLTFVKLREISLGYQIPVEKLRINRVVRGATASLVARNPWLLYRETDSFDPSEISALQGEDGQFPGSRSIGFNLKFIF